MDGADMEETSAATTETAAGEAKKPLETPQQEKIVDEAGVTILEPAPPQEAVPRSEGEVKPSVVTGAPCIPPDPESMDMSSGAASLAEKKRPHDDGDNTALHQDGKGGEGPPSKAAGMRRPTLKPWPNTSSETRQAAKPPP
ncbi:hypothetical protein V5799_022655 [Amblyomma americanum]